MHIAQFIEEQKRLNPLPTHWWQRTSVWYLRAAMLMVFLGGGTIAVYLPWAWITAPLELRQSAGALGMVIFGGFTVLSVGSMWIGGWELFREIHRPTSISHGEALLVMIVGVLLAALVSSHYRAEQGKHQILSEETRTIQESLKHHDAESVAQGWKDSPPQ